ncbi:MAG: hypothetical protein NVS2B16_25680 [Chloroflexota bacterium]
MPNPSATAPSRRRRSPATAKVIAQRGQSDGPAVDRQGSPVVDPTLNVRALNAASEERLNDLSSAFQDYVLLLDRRQDDLRKAEVEHVNEVGELRANYEKELRNKETQRIDAISAKDAAAVQAAAEVQRAQATLLANQVATTGETLRTTVAAAATAQEQRLTTIIEPLQKSIDDLRRVQYEQQGQKTGQSDPMLFAIAAPKQTIDEQRGGRTAHDEGRTNNQWTVGLMVVFAVGLIQVGLHFIR